MNQRFTRNEVARMIGVTPRQLDYWARLRLVNPRARWGERFFSFADLVALKTVQQLARRRIPARRLRRAMTALEAELGQSRTPLSELRVTTNGSRVVVRAPALGGRPIEPLTGQFVLEFDTGPLADKVRSMGPHTAEEWFEIGLAYDSSAETLEKAAEAYRKAAEAAPDWVEAHINLGTVLFQLQRPIAAQQSFATAARIEPNNPLVHFNLGCVLEQMDKTQAAIEHFRRAVSIAPHMADAHLNLALTYERLGQKQESAKHLSLYLRYEPQGPWAEFARSRINEQRSRQRGKLTPFRRNA